MVVIGLPASALVDESGILPCRHHSTIVLHAHKSPGEWTIGPLVAVVQRHSLTSWTWSINSWLLQDWNRSSAAIRVQRARGSNWPDLPTIIITCAFGWLTDFPSRWCSVHGGRHKHENAKETFVVCFRTYYVQFLENVWSVLALRRN
jgi:hypothetical protein